MRQWFLRTGGEAVFGPVSTQGLIVWAEQGRILPGHEVSTDRKTWQQAVSVDVLDMRWYVDDGEGELRGPLNRLAAEALIRSGKVREGAQLIAADEADLSGAAEKASAPQEKAAREALPEDVLRVRIRELEAMVSGQRERLLKLSGADAVETIQHERDVLKSVVKELEAERDTIVRNAEKDARASERKLEQARQQVRRLEQQVEESNRRLLAADEVQAREGEAAQQAAALQARLTAAEADAAAQREALARENEALRQQVAGEGRKFREAAAAAAAEREALRGRVAELEREREGLSRRAAEAEGALAAREAVEAMACGAREAAEAAAEAAARRAAEAEAALAELLTEANARDAANVERLAALEKLCALSPQEADRIYADQVAVYDLLKAESDALGEALEAERSHLEALKEWGAQRQAALADRRQALLRRLGDGPAEMTRRTLREQQPDPNTARLRKEIDELRMTYQQTVRQAEEREREQARRQRVLEAETTKFQLQVAEADKQRLRMQELEELLRKREQALADERKSREAEREQFQASQQALSMRIDALERAGRPTAPEEIQSAEARNVKIPAWMRLKQ